MQHLWSWLLSMILGEKAHFSLNLNTLFIIIKTLWKGLLAAIERNKMLLEETFMHNKIKWPYTWEQSVVWAIMWKLVVVVKSLCLYGRNTTCEGTWESGFLPICGSSTGDAVGFWVFMWGNVCFLCVFFCIHHHGRLNCNCGGVAASCDADVWN